MSVGSDRRRAADEDLHRRLLLKIDEAIYGNSYETEDGERIDPRTVRAIRGPGVDVVAVDEIHHWTADDAAHLRAHRAHRAALVEAEQRLLAGDGRSTQGEIEAAALQSWREHAARSVRGVAGPATAGAVGYAHRFAKAVDAALLRRRSGDDLPRWEAPAEDASA